jgi:hypothetical protein
VLTVRPLEVLFRFPAINSTPARFTPDLNQVLFVSSLPQSNHTQIATVAGASAVERWSIADESRSSFTRVGLENCEMVALSPVGRVLGCDDLRGTLKILDVSSGDIVFEKKNFAKRDYTGTLENPCYEVAGMPNSVWAQDRVRLSPSCYSGDPGLAIFSFSPDDRFLIAEPEYQGSALEWDVGRRRTVQLAGALRQLRKRSQVRSSYPIPFAFVAPDRVLLYRPGSWREEHNQHTQPFALISVPGGVVLATANLPMTPSIQPAADPNFVLIRPVGGPASGAVEIKGGGETITSDGPALDVLGKFYVAQPAPGEVGLYERGKGLQTVARLR